MRHLPLPMHEHAKEAAAIAVCSERLGAFPETHEYLFQNMDWEDEPAVLQVAQGVPLPLDALRQCIESNIPRIRLRSDSLWAIRLQIKATPTVVSRSGRAIIGVPSLNDLEQLLRR